MNQRPTTFNNVPNQYQTRGKRSISSRGAIIADHAEPLLMTQPGPMLPPPIQQKVDRRQQYKTHIYRLGITEIVLGALSIIFTIASLAIVSSEAERYLSTMSSAGYGYSHRVHTGFTYAAAGIWGGLSVVVVGMIALRIKTNPSRAVYIGHIIIAFMTANFTFAATAVAVLAAEASFYSSALRGLHITVALLNSAATISAIVHLSLSCCGAWRGGDPAAKPVMYFPAHGNTAYQQQPQYIQCSDGQLMMVLNQSFTAQSTQFVASDYPVSPYTAGPPPPTANTHYPTRIANSCYPAS